MKLFGETYKKGVFPLNWVGGIYVAILAFLIIGGIIAAYQQNWESVGLSLASIAFFVVPFFVEKQFKIYIPSLFTILIGAFLYATIILGQIEHYYQKHWWWDIMLHSGSGIAFGLIGLMVIVIFFKRGRIAAKPIVLCLFAFCFSLAAGLLWEVFEFSGDELVHTNMQQRQTGVVDTMKDEIVDTIGALIGSAIGYFYLRNDLGTPLDVALNKTVRKNRKRS
ncbi:hypothetical protein H0X32_00410 [Patescibacteria group bacterium]|nr:hypothetical protein [Patescibacteria group bacterium]